MKKYIRRGIIFCCVFGVLGAIQGFKYLLKQTPKLFLPVNLKVEVDAVYSDTVRSTISAFVERNIPNVLHKNVSFQDFSVEVKRLFPLVSGIEVDIRNRTEGLLRICSYRPEARVNDALVFTAHGVLADAHHFREDIFLPGDGIAIDDHFLQRSPEKVSLFLRALPRAVRSQYYIECTSGYDILLKPKKDVHNDYCLVSHQEGLSDKKKIEAACFIGNHCEALKNHMKKKAKERKEVFIDMRFKNCIYVRKRFSLKEKEGKKGGNADEQLVA